MMKKRVHNWYGCYKPDGEFCMHPLMGTTEIVDRAEVAALAHKENAAARSVDSYYADLLERSHDVDTSEGLKDTLRGHSDISFCDACLCYDRPKVCKERRKELGLKVFY